MSRWSGRILIVPRPLPRRMVVSWFLPLLVGDAAPGQAALIPCEPCLSLTDQAGVGHGGALRVGEVGGDAHVDPHHRAR